jgi:hypothetical protein
MPRKSTKKKRNPKKLKKQSDFDGADRSAQDSEYLALRKRVDARKDAKQILKIAKRIQGESDQP